MGKNFQELRAGMSARAKAASAIEHLRLLDEVSLSNCGKRASLLKQRRSRCSAKSI